MPAPHMWNSLLQELRLAPLFLTTVENPLVVVFEHLAVSTLLAFILCLFFASTGLIF